MQVTINISERILKDVLMLQSVEEGRQGNYIRLEDRVNNCRYDIQDKVMTIVMNQIKKMQGRKPDNHIY